MKTTLACLFIALLWNVAATQTTQFFSSEPRSIYLANSAAGHWATLVRYHTSPETPGYDPRNTMLVTSWQPVVTPTSPGRWQITFQIPPKQ